MDRAKWVWLMAIVAMTGLWLVPESLGEVILASPKDKSGAYPSSRWGEAPVQPIVTFDRKPAGMVYQEDVTNMKNPPIQSQSMGPTFGESNDPFQSKQLDFSKGVQEVAIIAGDLGYFPRTVFVNRNIPVRLYVTGASKNTLCFMLDSFHVRKQVKTQQVQEITFTPNSPGQYRFYCPINGMEGSLIVKEFAASNSRLPASEMEK